MMKPSTRLRSLTLATSLALSGALQAGGNLEGKVDRYKIKALKCAREMVQDKNLTVERVDMAAQLLEKLKGNSDLANLEQLGDQCRLVEPRLDYGTSLETKRQIVEYLENRYSGEIKTILKDMIIIEQKCVVRRVMAQAAFLLGVKVGAGVITCKGSDGRTRNYAGPSIGVATNFGADVGVEKIYIDPYRTDIPPGYPGARKAPISKYGAVLFDKTSNFTLGIYSKNYNEPDDRGYYGLYAIDSSDEGETYSVGLSSLTGSSANLTVRVFNGKADWSSILQRLD